MKEKKLKKSKSVKQNWSAWLAYSPRLHKFLVSKLPQQEDAQDIMQEAYLRLIRIRQQDLIRDPEAYLFRIASNLVGEFFHKQNKQPAQIEFNEITENNTFGDEGSFAQNMSNRAELQKLDNMLSTLPPLYKAVVILRKRDGLTHDEIAERLDISTNTVHKYMTRALAKCRMELEN